MLVTCKVLITSEDALLIKAKRQNFKKKHVLVDWIGFSYLGLK